uniref:Chondroadherin-like protein n=1 Tax=Scleropages formosus TaxID=113540 RepID=A0A8C9V3S8_SCLFO
MGFAVPSDLVVLLLLISTQAVHLRKCPRTCVCDDVKLTVACVRKNLTRVPTAVSEITVKLDLRGNNIQELPTGAFRHIPYLTHLSLHRCAIQRVQEGAFRSLGRLVFLDLANNNIEILYQESFDGLSSLKQLLLDHNRVEEIQPGAFSQLGFLNLLSLTHNQLVYLPNMAFQGLQNIKWLRLSHNSLNNLAPEAFGSLLTLARLSLDHNELQLPQVTRLDLGHNPITYLGEETISMPKLTHLFMDHMSLQDFSMAALAFSPRLVHLDLSHNQLRVLQPLVGPAQLTRLNLTGNPIHCSCYLRPLREWALSGFVRLAGACARPPHFSGENLEALHPTELRCQSQEAMLEAELEEINRATLTTTPVPRIPSEHRRAYKLHTDRAGIKPNLLFHLHQGETHHSSCENRGHTKVPHGFSPDTRFLDLRDNHFHYIPSHSFRGLVQVVSLHIQRCKIHELEGATFSGMKALVYLYLSENDLSSLSAQTFRGAPELTYLHLEKNKFARFPWEAFKLLPNLLSLHLEHNAISRLEQGVLAGAKRLRELYLTGNVINMVAPNAFDSASALDTLHMGSNQLKEVPAEALGKLSHLAELRLSKNPIRWVGPSAFLPLAGSLKHLYLNGLGLEKVRGWALAGLGPGLQSLFLEENQLEEVPLLSPLTGLKVVNLAENPLLCDCALLPLRKWIDTVNLTVSATCGHPSELRGQEVKDVKIFKSCPGEGSPPTKQKASKTSKPKSTHQCTCPKIAPVKKIPS